MRKIIWDAKFIKIFEEAREALTSYRIGLEKQLPEGWEINTLMCPIQYEKKIKMGGKRYIGYLRSRWGHPFSVEIYERGRKYKLKKLIFSHKPVDKTENNPPLKSIKIIDRHLRKMRAKN